MIRRLCTVAVVVILAGGLQHSRAQPTPAASGPKDPLEEAKQLNQQVLTLYRDSKFLEAIPLAERGLALREQALGPMHLDVATSLNNLAELYRAQGAHAKAEPLLVRSLAIREKALGPMHPDVAQILNNLGRLHRERGAFDKAEPLYGRALAIREKTLGPMHPDVAQSLNNLALLYQAQSAYAKAEPLLVRALDIVEKARGPMHPDVATGLNNLALLYEAQGLYPKAEPLLVRALDIAEKFLGPAHPAVAESLSNLAALYQDQGAIGNAEPLLVRALAILEKVLGPEHLDVATGLNNLALLYCAQGAFDKAEPLYTRALGIREKVLGPMHPTVARSLNNLAGLYQAQAAYGKAEPLYVRALAIRERALGPNHLDVALSLNNLAGVYQDQAAYEKAEPLLIRALAIREKALGPLHPHIAASLNNLATVYNAQNAHEKAEPLLVRALEIHEKALGPMHPDVATSLSNLALFYARHGAYDKAEALLIRALDVTEKALGPTRAAVAIKLNNLAGLYREQRAYKKAEPLAVRALDILEKAQGPMHPDVAVSLNNLAGLYWAQGAADKAAPLMARVAEIRETELRTELARLPEPRKRAVMTSLRGETDMLVSLQADAMASDGPVVELALTAVLRRKGRILDSLAETETTLLAHLTPALRDQLGQLTRAPGELVARLYAPAGPRSAADRAVVAAVHARIDELEFALSAASDELRAQTEPVTVAKVQAALPAGAALVEFVRYQRFDAQQIPRPWQGDRYLAYVVTAHAPPRWIALGDAAPIDAGVDAMLAAMNDHRNAEAAKAALQRLDALVLAPIRGRLAGVSHVILAPDGKLNLVPFEALVDPKGRYALEQYLVSYVTSGRDLLRFAVPHKPRSPSVIVADPDYGPMPSPVAPGTMLFVPLVGARAEATDLGRYFSAPPLTRAQATKAALAALAGPAILHVATHGFYARAPGTPAGPASVAVPVRPVTPARQDPTRGMFIDQDLSSLPPPRADVLADALDRAGLAMAGANQGAGGIVTAREIAGFDWWGTQLVVLSACETGVGVAPSGDGVYGMRRALVLAGTESQVISLWSVSDASAPALMRDYYRELARGTGRAEALRQAKLRMLRQPRQPRYAHPYYWAAFIPAGDWRPLDRNTLRLQGRTP